MGGPFRKIAVVQGMPSAQVQELFRTLVDRWQPSTRLAGVIAEDHGLAGTGGIADCWVAETIA